MTDHVSFATDDEPEGPICPRLHMMCDLDYYIAIAPGEQWPAIRHTFRARTDGARDQRVTLLVAALFKLGRGDLEGAKGCAQAFMQAVDREG